MSVSEHAEALNAMNVHRMRMMLRHQREQDEDDLFAVHEMMSGRMMGGRLMGGHGGRGRADDSWQRLPTRTLSEHDVAILSKSEEKKSCSICLTEYAVGDTTRSLPCFHEFHRECIDQWFRRQNEKGNDCSCPLDRKKIKDTANQHVH